MQLNFKLQIGLEGSLIDISEPTGFDGVSFSNDRNREYYGLDLRYSGNNGSEYTFDTYKHENVFNLLVNEFKEKGFEGFILIQVLDGNNIIFVGEADLVTAETDEYITFKCQFIERNELYTMEKRKSIKVDLFQEPKVKTNDYILRGIEVENTSVWRDDTIEPFLIGIQGGFDFPMFNNIRFVKNDGLRDTLSWLEYRYNRTNNDNRYLLRLIRANSEYQNIKIKIKTKGSSLIQGSNISSFRAFVAYGDDKGGKTYDEWYNSLVKVNWLNLNLPILGFYEFGNEGNAEINIPTLSRGQGIWMWFETTGAGGYKNNNNEVVITATTRDFVSKTKSVKLADAIKDVVKKSSSISDVIFPNDGYFTNNHLFNGNMLRDDLEKPLNLDWEFCKKLLKERNYGYTYDSITNKIEIRKFEDFYKNIKLVEFDNIANNQLVFTTDDSFVKNKVSYKFKSFQSQKEIEMVGNANVVHGNSEWFIQNKNVEGDLDISLDFSRDGYLIEQQRIKAFTISENTATNEDSNIFIVDSTPNSDVVSVTENVFLNVRYDAEVQRLAVANNGEFSFLRIGLTVNNFIRIDGFEYLVTDAGHTLLSLALVQGSPILTQNKVYALSYNVFNCYSSIMTNGLLNLNYSIKQNILSYLPMLSVLNNYNNKPIVNTMYEGNQNMVIRGTKEGAELQIFNKGVFEPKSISITVHGYLEDYYKLQSKEHGFIRVFNHNREAINLFPNRIDALIQNNSCGECKFEIDGNIKTYSKLKVVKNFINEVYEGALTFDFDDQNETVSILNSRKDILFKDIYFTNICDNGSCFTDYQTMKNYLLNLY